MIGLFCNDVQVRSRRILSKKFFICFIFLMQVINILFYWSLTQLSQGWRSSVFWAWRRSLGMALLSLGCGEALFSGCGVTQSRVAQLSLGWRSLVWGVVQLCSGCGVALFGVWRSSVQSVAQLSSGCVVAQLGVRSSSVRGVEQLSSHLPAAKYVGGSNSGLARVVRITERSYLEYCSEIRVWIHTYSVYETHTHKPMG